MQISIKASYKLILWFWWGWSSIPKFPKITSLQCLCNVSEKKLEMKSIFTYADKHQFPTRWYYRFRWVWSSILKLLKVTSFQYLHKSQKRELGMKFIFCMQINSKVSVSCHYRFLMEVASLFQSTQNRKLVIFVQYIKKELLQLLSCSVFNCNAKHSNTLRGSSHVHFRLFSQKAFS